MARGALVILVALALAPQASAACARVASPHGSDAAAGSAAHPYRTVARLLRGTPAGATACLAPGTYRERVVARRPVHLQAAYGRPAIVGGVTFLLGARGSSLRGLTIAGAGRGRAAVVVSADQVTVAGNRISGRGYVNRSTACVLLDGSRASVVDRNRIETCTRATRHGVGAAGIALVSAYATHVTNNLVVHTSGNGIVIGPNGQRSRVVHNLVDGNVASLVITGNGRAASSYNIVESNILSNAGTNNVRSSFAGPVGRGNVVVANCIWQGFAGNIAAPHVRVEGNLVTSPRYADRPRDYTVRAARCLAKRPALVAGSTARVPAFRVTFHVRALKARVQVVRLGLAGLTPGARLSARCVSRCSGAWRGVARSGSVTLPLLQGAWLPVGASLDVRATRAGFAGAWARVRVTGLPNGLSVTHACLRPGSTVAVSCRSIA